MPIGAEILPQNQYGNSMSFIRQTKRLLFSDMKTKMAYFAFLLTMGSALFLLYSQSVMLDSQTEISTFSESFQYKSDFCNFTVDDSEWDAHSVAVEARKLVDWLKIHYVERMAQRIRFSSSKVKFLRYNCDKGCGGLGNRFMGIVSDFYLALATDRALDIQILDPLNTNKFFRLNADFYGVPNETYIAKLQEGDECLSFRLFDYQSEQNINNYESLVSQFYKMDPLRCVEIASWNYEGVKMVFQNPILNHRLCPMMAQFNLNYHVLASAAMNILFDKPTPRLEFEVKKAKRRFKLNWSEYTKIGVQVRMENPEWNEKVIVRVCKSQVRCFVEATLKVIQKHDIKNPLVFVTGDVESTINYLVKEFNSLNITARKNIAHGLVTNISWKPAHTWGYNVKTFVDWILLTRMDYLIITQSTYGETSQHFSMAPYLIFNKQAGFTAKCDEVDSKGQKCDFGEYNTGLPKKNYRVYY